MNKKTSTYLITCLLSFYTFTSCVSKRKYIQLSTEKNLVDSTLIYLQTQLELAEIREQRRQRNYDNSYRQLNDQLKSLRQELQVSSQELRDLITEQKNKNEILYAQIQADLYVADQYQLYAHYDRSKNYTPLNQPIYFRSGQTQLASKEQWKLDYLISVLKENPELKIQVVGHTDKTPPRYGDNLDVSYQRAKAVRNYFLNRGVVANQLEIVAQGALKKALDSNNLPIEDADLNRRVEFILLTDKNLD